MTFLISTLMVGTMCVSSNGNINTPAVETAKPDRQIPYIENIEDIKCDCDENILIQISYGDWIATHRTGCQYGKGFCTDEAMARTVTEVWSCSKCPKHSLKSYVETKKSMFG